MPRRGAPRPRPRGARGGDATRSRPRGVERRASTPRCCSPRRRAAIGRGWRPSRRRRWTRGAARRFGEMVRRRVRREPVAYILGRKGFRRLELAVDGRALIPRPETELLVEIALELEPRTVLDVGTGSGAVALAVADELPECEVTATDTSRGRARRSRARERRAARARRAGPPSSGARCLPGGRFDLVVANLPYVREGEWPRWRPEITEYEPREALVAGADGLEAIATVAAAVERRADRRGRRCARGRRRAGRRGRRAPARPRVRAGRGAPGPGGHSPRGARSHGGLMVVSIARDGAATAREALERCVAGGGVAVFPADTLYGLACDPLAPGCRSSASTPSRAATTASPRRSCSSRRWRCARSCRALGPRTREALGALLPGPVTLVVANPEHRYPLACREDPERLGLRLIEGPLAGARCAIFQTSANRSGEPAPSRFEDVDARHPRGRRPGDRRRRAGRRAVDGGGSHGAGGRGHVGGPARGGAQPRRARRPPSSSADRAASIASSSVA